MSAANVQVLGVDRPVGLLKESLTAFRKHHEEVANALLNVTEGADKDDPRPAYQHRDWPKMIYHSDGREQLVTNDRELESFTLRGFRSASFPKVQVAIGDPAAEKKVLLDEIRERDGKLAVQNEMLMKALARLEALEAVNLKKGK